MHCDLDLIIIGAGPAGCSAAYHAAAGGLRVLLVDRKDFPRDKVCGDVVGVRAIKFLSQMGFKECDLLEAGAQRILAERFFRGENLVKEYETDNSGAWTDYPFTIPRFALDEKLLQVAIEKGADWKNAVEIRSVNISENGSDVTVNGLKDGQALLLMAPYVIISAGAFSSFYRELQADGCLHKNDIAFGLRQYVLAADRTKVPTLNYFYLSDLSHGYAWIFVVNDHINTGIWTNGGGSKKPGDLQKIFKQFVEENNIAKNYFCGSKPLERLKGAYMRTKIISSLGNHKLLWAGEAAGLTSPLLGEGIAPALMSGKIASETIIELRDHEGDEPSLVNEYKRRLFRAFPDRYELLF